jgi:hypothetical protein
VNVIPIALGGGAVLVVGLIIGFIGLSRRSRNPLPRDRWRP